MIVARQRRNQLAPRGLRQRGPCTAGQLGVFPSAGRLPNVHMLPHGHCVLMEAPHTFLLGVHPLGSRVTTGLSLPRQPPLRPSACRILLELPGATESAGCNRLLRRRVQLGQCGNSRRRRRC
jgi:hypothetical protein